MRNTSAEDEAYEPYLDMRTTASNNSKTRSMITLLGSVQWINAI